MSKIFVEDLKFGFVYGLILNFVYMNYIWDGLFKILLGIVCVVF